MLVTVELDDNISSNSITSTTLHPTLTHAPLTLDSTSIDRAKTPPVQHGPVPSLLSPPATPKKTRSPHPSRSPSPVTSMNRAPLHGAPARPLPPHLRGRAPPNSPSPSFGNQDARSNYAVQPAANTGGSFKLKKAAVKIVGAAAPAPPPNTPQRAPAPAPAPTASSPAPAPVKAEAKQPDWYVYASLYDLRRGVVAQRLRCFKFPSLPITIA